MKKKKFIDVTTEGKKKEVFERLNSFRSKNQAHIYFGISDNKQGVEYLRQIANDVGFDLTIYKERQKRPIRYCKQCGKEISSKWGKEFCSSSCAATYNNEHRDKSVYEKVAVKLRKEEHCVKKERVNTRQEKTCNNTLYEVRCKYCGKTFNSTNKNAKFCTHQCASNEYHKRSYKDFLENPQKYCRGNYTPKMFKKEFLEEQKNRCAICGCVPEHNGKPLVFVLDHIDGDASNNRRENLRMVCPNCDSQLDTFKSKNKFSTRRNYWKENIIHKALTKENNNCLEV